MSTVTSLKELLVEQLKDLYSAETQLVKALPKMAKAATDEDLKTGFTEHWEQTKTHVERLEKVMEQLDESPKGKKCKAMEGLIAEGKEVLQMEGDPALIDSALIAAAQKVEHYEMAGYGTVRTLAERLGEDQIADLLQTTLDEEGETDKRLTRIAEEIDIETAEDDDEEDEE
ncbi:ferritin-like domain-containing protein [Horticoccus luteus]|uniref:Ferritin-like domain-containing protein n=1 Tax=Horticoccus luteus TaxID=2862869 RepID=A0A8F9XI06_9BACT|nr:ferritin-like domain-containing protein [Horticoccus luteus]QYM79915.1 ferritin-like domain-containing protein [Horticoccus luteus]